MSGLHLLKRPGVHVTWQGGRLRLGATPGTLTDDELALLREHREEVGGWLLLHKLCEAGFSLRLEPSQFGPGYVLIPTGTPAKGVDFPSLFELYDTFHDAAVALLLEARRMLNIAPTDWPKAAERFARESARYADFSERDLGRKPRIYRERQ
ncbi:hypothetical protein [Thermogutta sp.]|uniref:hypothetical protein n=1 Tax=Thermogutta sp. TaxID=1962930 RepID=UPI00321FB832